MTRLACFVHYRLTAGLYAAHTAISLALLALGYRLTHGGARNA